MLPEAEIIRAESEKTANLPDYRIFVIIGISFFFIFPVMRKFSPNPVRSPRNPPAILKPSDVFQRKSIIE